VEDRSVNSAGLSFPLSAYAERGIGGEDRARAKDLRLEAKDPLLVARQEFSPVIQRTERGPVTPVTVTSPLLHALY